MVATGTQDPKRFDGEGMNFRAKLIGVDDVPEARGDKMCQNSMGKLKGAVKASGEHKQRIVVNVSLEGLKIIDGVSMAIQYTHAVHRISFIARDVSDSRAFGYIVSIGDGTHKFFAIKTEKQAEQLVLSLRDLFQAVYDMKKQEVEDAKKKQEEEGETKTEDKADGETKTEEKTQEGQEPVYQVLSYDEPSDSPEHIYSVPQNNTPVPGEEKTPSSNLLDLEDQMKNIEIGMNTFDDMFADISASGDSGAKTDAWGADTATPASTDIPRNVSTGSGLDDLAGLDDSFKAPPPFSATFAAASSNPFGGSTGQPFGGQQFGQPAGQPGFGMQPGVVGARMPGAGMPGVVLGGTMPGTPMPQVRPGFPQPGPGFGQQPAMGGFGQPSAAGFGQQAAVGGFGQQPAAGFGQPAAGFGQQAAFPGAQMGAPQQQGFGAFGMAAGQPQQNMFPDSEPDPNILAPTVLNEPKESEASQESKKDAFADLVAIGGTDPRKNPKTMFTDLSAPPKKSLNELKVGLAPPRTPSPGPTSSPGVVTQASDPFGPLKDNGLPRLTDTSEDPFDTSYVHIPKPTSVTSPPADSSDPFLPPATQLARLHCDKMSKDKRGETSRHKHSTKKQTLTNGQTDAFTNDFTHHPPDEPPPPLPAEVKESLAGRPPPPPPRPKSDVTSSTARPRPVPKPRKTSSSPLSDNIPPSPAHTDTSPLNSSSSSSNDPFLSSQLSFGGKEGDKFDPFSDFQSDMFKENCYTVFDSSGEENRSRLEQDPFSSNPADNSLI